MNRVYKYFLLFVTLFAIVSCSTAVEHETIASGFSRVPFFHSGFRSIWS